MKKTIFFIGLILSLFTASAQIESKTTMTTVDIPFVSLVSNFHDGKNHLTMTVEVKVVDSITGNILFSRNKDTYTDSLYNVKYTGWNGGADLLTPYYAKRGLTVPPNLADNAFYNTPPYDKPRGTFLIPPRPSR